MARRFTPLAYLHVLGFVYGPLFFAVTLYRVRFTSAASVTDCVFLVAFPLFALFSLRSFLAVARRPPPPLTVVDVTAEPEADHKTGAGSLATALNARGFRRSGVLLRYTSVDGDDARVWSVLTSADGHTQGLVDQRGIVLRSLLEDGSIVVTSSPVFSRLDRLFDGPTERNDPAAGIWAIEGLGTDTVAGHVLRHARHLERVVARRGSASVAVTGMVDATAVERHLSEVRSARQSAATLVAGGIGLACATGTILALATVLLPTQATPFFFVVSVMAMFPGRALVARVHAHLRRRAMRPACDVLEAPDPAREAPRAAEVREALAAASIWVDPPSTPKERALRYAHRMAGRKVDDILRIAGITACAAGATTAAPWFATWTSLGTLRFVAAGLAYVLALGLAVRAIRIAARTDPKKKLVAITEGLIERLDLSDEKGPIPPGAAFGGWTSPQLLRDARNHLPVKPPRGWSVPLAPKEASGAWMIETPEATVIAQLVESPLGMRFSVAILPDDRVRMHDYDSLAILRHFRGVDAFVEDDAPADMRRKSPWVRMFAAAPVADKPAPWPEVRGPLPKEALN